VVEDEREMVGGFGYLQEASFPGISGLWTDSWSLLRLSTFVMSAPTQQRHCSRSRSAIKQWYMTY